MPQECSEPSCTKVAAFRTRTRPAWCDEHITAILRRGGLEPLEPFRRPTEYRLTRCLRCGCVAHYRFEYTLDRNKVGELTCRARFWREWAQQSRAGQGVCADLGPVPEVEARMHAANSGYDYLEALTRPSLRDDPHRVRCRYCGRVSAQRLGDMVWGCSCQVNPRREQQATTSGTKKPELLKDSDHLVLAWWDHDNNDAASWQTAKVRARREVHWRCPDCGLRFTSRILDMTNDATCPDCEPFVGRQPQFSYDRLWVP